MTEIIFLPKKTAPMHCFYLTAGRKRGLSASLFPLPAGQSAVPPPRSIFVRIVRFRIVGLFFARARHRRRQQMWTRIGIAAIVAAFLVGAVAAAYAQDSMTPYPGNTAPGTSRSDQAGTGTGGTARGGYGTLGAGDAGKGDWAGTNPGVNRGPAGAYSGYGVGG